MERGSNFNIKIQKHSVKRFFAVFLLTIVAIHAQGQRAPKIDSVHMILLNPYVQIEATNAVNELYNFKFDESMRHLKYLKYEYGWHPLPYFLMGLNYWWRIQPNLNDTKYDDTFNAYMDSSIVAAERLYDKVNPIEGAFFLAAAYGFKARLHSDRENYRRAAWDGRKSLKYLKECNDFTEYSPEVLFGTGLINYYTEWIRENYPWLRPLMMFFPDGDKELGVEQLREVSRNAFYSRTEAQYYLLNILFHDRSEYGEALTLAEYLHTSYPDNSFFHRWYGRALFTTGRYRQAEPVCLEIIARIDSGQIGYEEYTGRFAAYFLGRIYKQQKNDEKSWEYFKRSEKFHELSNATEKGYYFSTLYNLGVLAYERDDLDTAEEYYKKVKKLAKRNSDAFKQAKEGLKNM